MRVGISLDAIPVMPSSRWDETVDLLLLQLPPLVQFLVLMAPPVRDPAISDTTDEDGIWIPQQ